MYNILENSSVTAGAYRQRVTDVYARSTPGAFRGGARMKGSVRLWRDYVASKEGGRACVGGAASCCAVIVSWRAEPGAGWRKHSGAERAGQRTSYGGGQAMARDSTPEALQGHRPGNTSSLAQWRNPESGAAQNRSSLPPQPRQQRGREGCAASSVVAACGVAG